MSIYDSDWHIWPIGSGAMAMKANLPAGVQDDGRNGEIALSGQADKTGSVRSSEVGGVNDRQPAQTQSGRRQAVETVKGLGGDGLIVLVIGNQGPKIIGTQYLGW
jgi:hypothetical protein